MMISKGQHLRVGGPNSTLSFHIRTKYTNGRGCARALDPLPSLNRTFNLNYSHEETTLWGAKKKYGKMWFSHQIRFLNMCVCVSPPCKKYTQSSTILVVFVRYDNIWMYANAKDLNTKNCALEGSKLFGFN